ncbi:tRNA (guanosine(46)-N7)-methyltransferase TrmB [Ammoniphilus oxalaticus]|uniref:tRNA (guanine-N(7)-)-methyltransferase n=1 Tax=Ammoniphilus oxalaticus TaxID=66863 RepID=A0A419SIM6_9BACL|nr:tRNA (guanosine(46)-N7)-methyltransferase TrmB [Ammoniphilus oxalaticus]RKD23768.1 tRNA (guanosine(46)-N7)-methyltransferase TrmB [Ammoniphilus oxalaticus]
MRLRKKPWIKDEIITYDRWVVNEPNEYRGRWDEWFQNKAPIHLELGTGKGNFVVTLAEKHADCNFIGVEIKEEVLIAAVRKSVEKGLKNIAFLWFNINDIEDVFAKDEVSRIYLNFSDPWPKNRHAKRRLTHRGFLEKYKKILNKGGQIHLKTDNEPLFEFSLNEFSEQGFQLRNITFDLHNSRFEEAKKVMTEYEQRFVKQGLKIYRFEAVV